MNQGDNSLKTGMKQTASEDRTSEQGMEVSSIRLGLDLGTYAVKGVRLDGTGLGKITVPTGGSAVEAAGKCLDALLEEVDNAQPVKLGLSGANADVLAEILEMTPFLEIESLQAGLTSRGLEARAVLSLGHENMYYLELDPSGMVHFFNRNGQCAAGSGAFWYQQATRMGYNDRELAQIALEAESEVKISGRCAVFAKSDMTHAINEGATQGMVSAGMARALADLVLTGVTLNRIQGPGQVYAVGGVAENCAVMKYIEAYCRERSVEVVVPPEHDYLNALGAAALAVKELPAQQLRDRVLEQASDQSYVPENPLPPLEPGRIRYMEPPEQEESFDLSMTYVGVDCGSVSTKCVLLDARGQFIGGVYLPTAGKPALQVLELMKEVEKQYGDLLQGVPMVACTTGSGRFLSQKILSAEYAVDEITCQAEGVKYLCGDRGTLSIIEIGGEDSKFLQIKDGVLFDYRMNPVCAAGTGTFLENLASLLGVQIEEEFSAKAFQAEYAIDLGDICTLLSQSTLIAAASRGLPLNSQLASLAYSSARNYINRTVENRPMDGVVVFTGATAKNYALASAFAAECDTGIIVPPYPELTGALGSAVIARVFHNMGRKGSFSFRSLQNLNSFTVGRKRCHANCEHEHNCTLDVIEFTDGSKFLYGDRCGRYSGLEKKAAGSDFPDYIQLRNRLFYQAAGDLQQENVPGVSDYGEPAAARPRVGLARGGMFFELYPFWAAFFRQLGAEVELSPETSEEILDKGKRELEAEMCYPMEVLVGHYQALVEKGVDFIFVPEVVDMEPLSWAARWPRAFTCPLLQTIKGVVANSLELKEERMLYAQLNYRDGAERIRQQLTPVAEKILEASFSQEKLVLAVQAGYRAQGRFRHEMLQESIKMMATLRAHPDAVVAVFLGRSYTLYDSFVSKGSLDYARQRGILAVPHDFILEYLRAWYNGQVQDPQLELLRDEFQNQWDDYLEKVDNIYPIQLQKMLSAVFWARFLNQRQGKTGLPQLNIVFQDPFKCGPNAMMRHYLGSLTGYLRLTLDEHTAPAGMITRLEAFKNTCLSRESRESVPEFYSSRTCFVHDNGWKKILIPEPIQHSRAIAAAFRSAGVDAELLPRSRDKDLSLARCYVNGDECLPLIQNVQDYLEYLENKGSGENLDGVVFFQGWACGPCRYGLYAPTQSLLINRAGYGEGRICSVKLADAVKRFGLKFIVTVYDGMLAMDLLYKMLLRTRPYELDKGQSDALFEAYSEKLTGLLENYQTSVPRILAGRHIKPLEELLREAAAAFTQVPKKQEKRPLILLGGEFYVRLDDRCNQDLIRKIEAEGGEVSLAPASELFSYTTYINYEEARTAFQMNKNWPSFLSRTGYGFSNWLAHRDERLLEEACGELLRDEHEPSPRQIREMARKYVSEHYGGEPPMAIGRVCAFARRNGVAGAIFVAPFTCMPGSVVESQMGAMRKELDLPMVTIYYDGKENANREEFIESLVFQARQRVGQRKNIEQDTYEGSASPTEKVK